MIKKEKTSFLRDTSLTSVHCTFEMDQEATGKIAFGSDGMTSGVGELRIEFEVTQDKLDLLSTKVNALQTGFDEMTQKMDSLVTKVDGLIETASKCKVEVPPISPPSPLSDLIFDVIWKHHKVGITAHDISRILFGDSSKWSDVVEQLYALERRGLARRLGGDFYPKWGPT